MEKIGLYMHCMGFLVVYISADPSRRDLVYLMQNPNFGKNCKILNRKSKRRISDANLKLGSDLDVFQVLDRLAIWRRVCSILPGPSNFRKIGADFRKWQFWCIWRQLAPIFRAGKVKSDSVFWLSIASKTSMQREFVRTLILTHSFFLGS